MTHSNNLTAETRVGTPSQQKTERYLAKSEENEGGDNTFFSNVPSEPNDKSIPEKTNPTEESPMKKSVTDNGKELKEVTVGQQLNIQQEEEYIPIPSKNDIESENKQNSLIPQKGDSQLIKSTILVLEIYRRHLNLKSSLSIRQDTRDKRNQAIDKLISAIDTVRTEGHDTQLVIVWDQVHDELLNEWRYGQLKKFGDIIQKNITTMQIEIVTKTAHTLNERIKGMQTMLDTITQQYDVITQQNQKLQATIEAQNLKMQEAETQNKERQKQMDKQMAKIDEMMLMMGGLLSQRNNSQNTPNYSSGFFVKK